AEDGIRDDLVTGVQTCALPISVRFGHVLVAATWTGPNRTGATGEWAPTATATNDPTGRQKGAGRCGSSHSLSWRPRRRRRLSRSRRGVEARRPPRRPATGRRR